MTESFSRFHSNDREFMLIGQMNVTEQVYMYKEIKYLVLNICAYYPISVLYIKDVMSNKLNIGYIPTNQVNADIGDVFEYYVNKDNNVCTYIHT